LAIKAIGNKRVPSEYLFSHLCNQISTPLECLQVLKNQYELFDEKENELFITVGANWVPINKKYL
jgi:hypothetical protein